MGRFFDSRAECDALVDKATNPDAPVESQLAVMESEAGETFGAILALRNATRSLEHSFGGGTGNDLHDAHTTQSAREPLAKLNLAIEEILGAAKDISWQAEVCTCPECLGKDKQRAAKYN